MGQCIAPVLCQWSSGKYRESEPSRATTTVAAQGEAWTGWATTTTQAPRREEETGIFLLPCVGDLHGQPERGFPLAQSKIHTLVSKACLLPTLLRPQWSSAQTPFTRGSVSRFPPPPRPGVAPTARSFFHPALFHHGLCRGGHLLT